MVHRLHVLLLSRQRTVVGGEPITATLIFVLQDVVVILPMVIPEPFVDIFYHNNVTITIS